MSGESDENFEGVTKFFPDEKFPDILSPDQNSYPFFFIPNQYFYPKFYTPIKNWIQIFAPWITEISALNVQLQDLFSI